MVILPGLCRAGDWARGFRHASQALYPATPLTSALACPTQMGATERVTSQPYWISQSLRWVLLPHFQLIFATLCGWKQETDNTSSRREQLATPQELFLSWANKRPAVCWVSLWWSSGLEDSVKRNWNERVSRVPRDVFFFFINSRNKRSFHL